MSHYLTLSACTDNQRVPRANKDKLQAGKKNCQKTFMNSFLVLDPHSQSVERQNTGNCLEEKHNPNTPLLVQVFLQVSVVES